MGMCCVQAELEDLSFAVLHPSKYCRVRMQLDQCWQLPAPFQPPKLFSEQPQNEEVNEQQSFLPPPPVVDSSHESTAESTGLQQQKRQAAVQTLNEVLYSFEQLTASG